MEIPLDDGFTVVTGPNGSGKSNILDGVLFCLGLASSKGMRADRLPDLVNSGLLRAGKSAETIVSVRFDLSDWEPDPAEEGLEPPQEGPWIKHEQKEWVVTRRLRVMPGGSYSSSYSSDGEPCNLQQLQTQLRRLRIDPEGSNVVMQGDVTRIVSMSNRDRRGLIDELAGVALFDGRIEQSKKKLDDVHDRQERCRIVEQELVVAKQKLERDCAKARTYQELKEKLHLGKKYELVLEFESTKEGLHNLKNKHQQLGEKEIVDRDKISEEEKELIQSASNLEILQEKVKALGEDQLISVQAEIAGLDTQDRELERQASIHRQEGEKLQELRQDLAIRRNGLQKDLQTNQEDSHSSTLEIAENRCKEAFAAVEVSRRRLGDAAGRSGVWLDNQKERIHRRQKLQTDIAPLQQEQQKKQAQLHQDETLKEELELEQQRDSSENQQVNQQLEILEKEWQELLQTINFKKTELEKATESLSVQQRTKTRLEQEQTRLEREIARIESRREALHESRGTGALKLLLESGLEGIHGHVAQLGEVEEHLRLALEVAAGARLGQVVVDDDRIAAKAIEILKNRRAGRLTFLPLNRIKASGSSSNAALIRGADISSKKGLIGRAVELVRFEKVYADVFAYVFGETLVFNELNSARIHLGRSRAVTLDGELLERSGAMTGGSFSGRNNGFSFGTSTDGDEAEPLRRRLLELGETLVTCRREERLSNKSLEELRPAFRKLEQRQAALEAERIAAQRSNGPLIERRRERTERLKLIEENQKNLLKELDVISKNIHPLDLEIKKIEEQENESRRSESESETWQKLQIDLESSDKALIEARNIRDELLNEQRQRQLFLERLDDQQKVLVSEEKRLQEAVEALTVAHKTWRSDQKQLQTRRKDLEKQQQNLQARFGEQRRARDVAEAKVTEQRQKLQEAKWALDHLHQEREGIAEELRSGSLRLKELEKGLPQPPPEVPEEVREAGLESLQSELNQLQLKMEALEPVNMLALEELEQLETRLKELIEKLEVLSAERSELLLRIETVATLRQEAFMEAFEAVDKHFREIFASLSDGDGHLQLDNSEDPLEGGLTLVAHPKGKTVRRLAAMSGGEKSLTALSFLFALQRFRPSPFYALDEVDSFLDGVNVERLSALIARQAEQAQFLVVSHRRPMISASSRTIGVTQARGAHTQVIGLPNAA